MADAEFRRIRALNGVHLEPVLKERCTAMLGPDWQEVRLAGEAWAYVQGGMARGIAGLEPVWAGRLVLWSHTGTLGPGDWRRILRFTRARLAETIARPDVRRIEATALLTAPKYCRFLEALGLQREGRLSAYSPRGETVDLFAITRAGDERI